MTVIIDRLDIVDTEPHEFDDSSTAATAAPTTPRLFDTLRIAAQRNARVHAD